MLQDISPGLLGYVCVSLSSTVRGVSWKKKFIKERGLKRPGYISGFENNLRIRWPIAGTGCAQELRRALSGVPAGVGEVTEGS